MNRITGVSGAAVFCAAAVGAYIKSQGIPERLKKPLAAVIPAVAATAMAYPAMRVLTCVQRTPQSTASAFQEITRNFKEWRALFTGAAPVIAAGIPQRILPYIVYTEVQDATKPYIANDLVRNFLSGGCASLVDSGFGCLGEIGSINKQDNAVITLADFYKTPMIRRAMGIIFSRDLVSNLFGYSVPKELRQACAMGESREERLATTFVSSGLSNILTTPLDCMKRTLLCNPDMTLGDSFKAMLKTKGLIQQYGLRLVMVSGRFTVFLIASEESYQRLKNF
jgi:hypothetical protein